MDEAAQCKHWDVIVVGGGSAGCVVASELSRIGRLSVLLIEAGRDTPPGAEPASIRDPFYASAMREENFWPDLYVNWISRRLGAQRDPAFYEQARIMGGGSSVNSMVAIRPLPDDFEERARSGLAGWSWTDVLPFFKEIETDRDFDGSLHGQSGPIPIRRHTMEEWPEFCKAVARVAVKRDLPLVEDMNADPSNGYGRIPMNNLPSQRVSAAMGFLDAAARQRPNLTVMTDVRVERLLCENQRVVGVEVTSGPKAAKFHGRAVFLCAGAIHSPAILMRSGIGPAEALKELGINIVADSPAVGRNLQEHPTVSVAAYLKPFAMQSESLRAHANLGIRMTSPQPWAPYGDIYTSVMAKSSWHALGRRIANFLISLHKPFSRGEVKLVSPDPGREPKVNFNFFDDDRDMPRMMSAVRYFWSMAKDPLVTDTHSKIFLAAFTPFVQSLNRYTLRNQLLAWAATIALDSNRIVRDRLFAAVLADGGDPDDLVGDDAALAAWIANNATGFYHPVGTCAMGANGNGHSVVDASGKVRGVEGLWIADASVMPSAVRANTNLTTMASALKLARGWREQALF